MKTITVLSDDGKPIAVEVVEGDHRADVTYKHPMGCLASASWRLLFIREALGLVNDSTFNKVCRMVGMPGEEYDWSFIRDTEAGVQDYISDILFKAVGPRMLALGLDSARHTALRKAR